MRSYALADFLKLSAVLNYQLSARQVNWESVITIMLNGKPISPHEDAVLLHVLDYLGSVYGHRKRRLGPYSVLHPLRSTSLLCQGSYPVQLLDLMTSLLHDNFEDVNPKRFKDAEWAALNAKFNAFAQMIPNGDLVQLMERLEWLTKRPGDTYYCYIGHLLEHGSRYPEVVRVKLADRLDNTFDMRIDMEDPLQGVDFYETIFQMMFTNTYKGYHPAKPHSSTMALNGAQRLYQLFKNIVLMSLVRQKKAAVNDPLSQEIFAILARASIKEAQRIALHIFGYHETSVPKFRELILETMSYAHRGGIDTVTSPTSGNRLDGIFMSVFDNPSPYARRRKLAALYKDKPLMVETALAFIVIFLSFLNDGNYYVHGISEEGVRPE